MMEDVPCNREYEYYLSDLAKSLTSLGLYHTVAPILAARMGAVITRRVTSGNRDYDWREAEYTITEMECLGTKYCLMESEGDAEVVRESADSLFKWLDATEACERVLGLLH